MKIWCIKLGIDDSRNTLSFLWFHACRAFPSVRTTAEQILEYSEQLDYFTLLHVANLYQPLHNHLQETFDLKPFLKRIYWKFSSNNLQTAVTLQCCWSSRSHGGILQGHFLFKSSAIVQDMITILFQEQSCDVKAKLKVRNVCLFSVRTFIRTCSKSDHEPRVSTRTSHSFVQQVVPELLKRF